MSYKCYPSPPTPHRVSLCSSNGWPRALCVDQIGLEISVILLSLRPYSGTKDSHSLPFDQLGLLDPQETQGKWLAEVPIHLSKRTLAARLSDIGTS